ncbi:ABC transporter ATP-binding protein [Virgibacillus soli]|uniref:ABC transporter ATP-binding protein n=1 Tax=Paracerasibacillus soli TaxID=480284 RepID=A0ABU5CSP6_9BACI|nr:ABC transporter ATP-binding protein [Virgibacillus soli]MDY0408839.1 ABC transporter ATP-binding protein [Virgibacillus soli]
MLHNVNKTYQTSTESLHVLKEINVTIESGSWLTITGPSGSGKTTFMRLLSGIEQADNGEVKVGQLDATIAAEKERRRFRRNHVGYVFQDFQLFNQFDVLTNVMIPLLPYEPRKVVEEKAVQLLDMVGLLPRKNHMPLQISGGEKQRTAIARALMNDPQLILCDEPTGNLDLENRNKIMEILREVHKKGVTIILVTHDPELADYGDLKFEMRDGHLFNKTEQNV